MTAQIMVKKLQIRQHELLIYYLPIKILLLLAQSIKAVHSMGYTVL